MKESNVTTSIQASIRFNIQKFDIKEQTSSYDLLPAKIQGIYDVQAYEELKASVNFAIASYVNNSENLEWNDGYICKLQIQVVLVGIALLLFVGGYIAAALNAVRELSNFSSGMSTTAIILWLFSVMCLFGYIAMFFHLRMLKRVHYVEQVTSVVQDALNLLNQKYEKVCRYSIARIYGSSNCDFNTSLQLKIRIVVIGAANVRFYDNNAINGGGNAGEIVSTLQEMEVGPL